MPGCSASVSFSNWVRVTTVLHASPGGAGSGQKPFTVIIGSSGSTFTSGSSPAAVGAMFSAWRRAAGGVAGCAACPKVKLASRRQTRHTEGMDHYPHCGCCGANKAGTKLGCVPPLSRLSQPLLLFIGSYIDLSAGIDTGIAVEVHRPKIG